MAYPIVFFDIAGEDDAALKSFYEAVCGWKADGEGKFEVTTVGPIQAAIRKDPSEKRLYVGVPDIDAAMALVEQAGGSVEVPRFEVPGVVVLGLFRDPAGNPMGFVEMDGERPKAP